MAEIDGLKSDLAIMIVEDEGAGRDLAGWLESLGWQVETYLPDRFPVEAGYSPTLIIMDGAIAADTRTRLVNAVRTGGMAAAGPILVLCDPDMADQPGASGRIALPLVRSDALAVIANWTGPLGDHAFRTLDNPHYRLVRLAGWDRASRLLSSFVRHLRDALTALEEGQDVRRTAHVVAGLAGPLGFAQLSALWSAVEYGDSNGIGAAVSASHAVVRQVNRWIDADKSETA